MAIVELLNATNQSSVELVSKVGDLITWLQAIGAAVVLWLIFNVVSLIINLKRKKYLKEIESKLDRIEKKINRLGKRKK